MDAACRLMIASGLLIFTLGVGTAFAQQPANAGGEEPLPLDAPATQLDPLPPAAQPPVDADVARPDDRIVLHEAVEPAQASSSLARQHISKEPPAPIAERPSAVRPDRKAQWVPGYWDWDQAQKDFVWVGGTWRVPPTGSIWVAGRWMRDSQGWYRTPGIWSQRRDAEARPTSTIANRAAVPAWRRTGPPSDHPNDPPGAAPGADYFYLAGHYVPDGDHVTWKPGFWAKVQPGWDWVPARWVRRSDGWEFRPGSWVRETGALAQNGDNTQRSTVRPLPADDTSSAIDQQAQPPASEVNPGALPPIGGGEVENGVPAPGADIPGAGAPGRPQTVLPPGSVVIRQPEALVFGRVTGLPYVVVRPPGYYPYGRRGVVVPAVVPPFVRDILNRVLP
jgi:hypothetical protein